MARSQQSQNLLLANLPSADFEWLRPYLRTIDMPRAATLVRSGEIARIAFFPHSGVISSILSLRDGNTVEVRMTGRDGALGATSGAAERAWFTSAVVRIEGTSSIIDLSELQVVIDRSPALRAALARSEAVQQAISDQSIACNATHDVEARLARRLMRLYETFGETKFEVTQEDLAEMLGIRSNAVSLVAHAMKQAGIIRYSRGLLEIADVNALHAQSCECHDAVTAYQHACERPSH
jgi:CRP-like cAMP-binding protein